MRTGKLRYLAMAGLLLATACGEATEGFDTKDDQVIRATSNGGRNEVFMLYVPLGNGKRTCSGSYYAPRVVYRPAPVYVAPPVVYRPAPVIYAGGYYPYHHYRGGWREGRHDEYGTTYRDDRWSDGRRHHHDN